MGCPKKLTRARQINISKSANHKQKRTEEDRAPTEARNSQKICGTAWTPYQWNQFGDTQFDLVDSWMATGLDWMGHRPLGHAGSTTAAVHCRQTLCRRREHAFK